MARRLPKTGVDDKPPGRFETLAHKYQVDIPGVCQGNPGALGVVIDTVALIEALTPLVDAVTDQMNENMATNWALSFTPETFFQRLRDMDLRGSEVWDAWSRWAEGDPIRFVIAVFEKDPEMLRAVKGHTAAGA